MARATARNDRILGAARALMRDARPLIARRGLTLIGITVAGFDEHGGVQLELPLDGRSRADLDAALDAVRERFGTGSITRAVLLGRDAGPSVPMLPD